MWRATSWRWAWSSLRQLGCDHAREARPNHVSVKDLLLVLWIGRISPDCFIVFSGAHKSSELRWSWHRPKRRKPWSSTGTAAARAEYK